MGRFLEDMALYSNTGMGAGDASLYTISGVNKRRAARAEQSYAEIPTVTDSQRYASNYYKGLKGLSAADRQVWEQKYSKYILGKSDAYKDDIFRTVIFQDMLENSEDPSDIEMLEKFNQGLITRKERDRYFSTKAISQDLDGISNFIDERRSWGDRLDLQSYYMENDTPPTELINPFTDNSVREEAVKFLHGEGTELAEQEYDILKSDDTGAAQVMQELFNESLREMFPYFKEYEGKLDLTDDEYTLLLARYRADMQLGGSNYAYRNLNRQITDLIGKNLTPIEKLGNTTALFVDSGAGMIIRAVGMTAGIFGYGEDEDSYMNNIIDNPITRYGDRLATTHSWKKSEQIYLEEMGMSDNPILGTYDQLKALLSWNTPFELVGLYGFTTASTILTMGGSGLVNLGFKGIGSIHKASMAGKALNTTAKGVKFLRGLSKAKDTSITMLAGAVGTIEGGMNASLTYNITKKNLDNQANLYKYTKAAELYADQLLGQLESGNFTDSLIVDSLFKLGILSSDSSADQILEAIYEFRNNPEFIKQISEYLFSDPNLQTNAEYWIQLYAPQLNLEYADIMEQNKIAAERALYTDFTINSFINGLMRTTLQAGLNAAPVRKSINRTMGKKSKYGDKVQIHKDASGKWVATKKQHTKMLEFWQRSKTSLGEGIEEGTQEISSKFGLDLANSRIEQYYEYLNGEGTSAFIEDLSATIEQGLFNLGEHLTSKETIKSFLYGSLSTMLGGPNINNDYNRGKRLEGESRYQYIKRNSPIIWNSAFGAFMPGATDEENKKREKIAEKLNGFFADLEIQQLLSHAGQAADIMATLDEALRSGDEMAVRDARAEQMIQAILLLSDTEGSTYYDTVLEGIRLRLNFKRENLQDPNSAESKAVAEYRLTIGNVKQTEEESDIQILDRIIKLANKFSEFQDKVKTYTEEYRNIIGEHADIDAINSLVFQQIMLDNAESRLKKLDESISTRENEIRAHLAKKGYLLSTMSKSIKLAIILHGSVDGAIKYVEEGKKLIEDLSATLDKAKQDSKKIGSRQAKRRYNQLIKNMSKAIEDMKKQLLPTSKLLDTIVKEQTENPENTEVLSIEDILSLDSREKSQLLRGYEEGKLVLSEDNKKVIEKYKEYMTKKGSRKYQEVIDRGIIQDKAEQEALLIYLALTSPNEFTTYANQKKVEARTRALEGQYNYLSTIEDYDQLVMDIRNAFKKGKLEGEIAKLLASKNKLLWDRYLNEEEIKNKKKKEYLDLLKRSNINSDGKQIFETILDSLMDNNINVEDSNAVSQYIGEHYDELMQKAKKAIGISDTKENLMSFFNNTIGELKEINTKIQRLKVTTPKEDPVKEEPQDSAEETTKAKILAVKNKLSSLNFTYVNSLSQILDSFNLSAEKWEKIATIIEDTIKANAANTQQIKINILNNILKTGIIDNKEFAPNTILDKWCKEINYAVVIKALEDNNKRSKSNKDYPGAIHGIGLLKDAGVNDLYKTLYDYQERYKIRDFLRTLSELNIKDATVYFILDSELNRSIKGDLGAQFGSEHTAVVAVIETEQSATTIEIDGKHYLPVAIMPLTYSPHSTGSTNMATIRLGISSTEDYSKPFIIKNNKEEAYQSKFINVSYDLVQQTSNGLVHLAAKQDNMTQQDALEKDSWEHFRRLKWYKDIRSSLLDKITYTLKGVSTSFKYSIESKAGSWGAFLNRRSLAQTRSTEIPGRPTLIEVFASGNTDNILRFNPIIMDVVENLLTLSLKKNNVTTDEDAKIAIKNALEGIYYKGTIVVERTLDDTAFNVGLSYTNDEGIPVYVPLTLGELTNGNYSLSKESIVKLLTSIMFRNGESGPIISEEGLRPGTHWQLSKDWVDNRILSRLERAFDSDIFEVVADSLKQDPNLVTLTNPEKTKISIAPPKASINTTPTTTPMNEEVKLEEVKIEDATIKEKVEKALKTLKEKHEEIVLRRKERGLDSIKEEVAITTLSGDLNITTDGFIKHDEIIKENDPEKMAYPIGNTIDAFVRDLFDNKIVKVSGKYVYQHNGKQFTLEEVYPNIRDGHLQPLTQAILQYKSYAEEVLGYTFISQEYFLEGKLNVTTSLNVRGTVTFLGIPDLIAYDREGNFHIIDTKTMRLPKTNIRDAAKKKCNAYAAQTSLYAIALELSLGVRVASTSMLPIYVNYTELDVKNSALANSAYNADTHSEIGNSRFKVAEILVKTISGKYSPFKNTNPSVISNGSSTAADKIIFKVDRIEMNKLRDELSKDTMNAFVAEAQQPSVNLLEQTIEELPLESIIDISFDTMANDDFLQLDSEWMSSGSKSGSSSFGIGIIQENMLYSEQSDAIKSQISEEAWNNTPSEERENYKECNG